MGLAPDVPSHCLIKIVLGSQILLDRATDSLIDERHRQRSQRLRDGGERGEDKQQQEHGYADKILASHSAHFAPHLLTRYSNPQRPCNVGPLGSKVDCTVNLERGQMSALAIA